MRMFPKFQPNVYMPSLCRFRVPSLFLNKMKNTYFLNRQKKFFENPRMCKISFCELAKLRYS